MQPPQESPFSSIKTIESFATLSTNNHSPIQASVALQALQHKIHSLQSETVRPLEEQMFIFMRFFIYSFGLSLFIRNAHACYNHQGACAPKHLTVNQVKQINPDKHFIHGHLFAMTYFLEIAVFLRPDLLKGFAKVLASGHHIITYGHVMKIHSLIKEIKTFYPQPTDNLNLGHKGKFLKVITL